MKFEIEPLQDYGKITASLENSVLPPGKLNDFASLFKSEEDYCRIMGDLCTIREHLSKFFEFEDSPLAGQTGHPIFKMASTLNDIVGFLLKQNYSLMSVVTAQGTIIKLVDHARYYPKNN